MTCPTYGDAIIWTSLNWNWLLFAVCDQIWLNCVTGKKINVFCKYLRVYLVF